MTDQIQRGHVPAPRDDQESYTVDAEQVGPPVDPELVRPTFADITRADEPRPPIVPAWLRSADQRRQVVRWSIGNLGYLAGRHLWRSPRYVGLALIYAPRGAWRLVAGPVKWATAEEGNWHLRQQAANRNDAATWMQLDHVRERQSSWRWWIVGGGFGASTLGCGVLGAVGPEWTLPALAAAALPALARLGRPADRPIIDRVQVGPKFVRLTAEQVRAALVAIGAAKDPAALRFPQEIHRDGPGYLARVDLPAGGEAIKVIEARGKLSSALRLPVDQVWPTTGPDHAGQVDLWVGMQPASKMPRSRWPLASPTARTSCFEPIPFGVDQRGRPIDTIPFQRNYLIGGQPGSGKTFAGRALVFGALLDPTAEVWLAAFKASEDFHDVAEFCTRYVCGVDDVTMNAAEQMVAAGLAEVRRRQTLLGKLKREGKIAEGRTDAELAAANLGLHPLILVFDEVHELFLESKQAVEDMTRLIKQGRSAGVIVVLITQVADKDSVPPNVTRCVSSRWCLSVADQVANDQIMGTGAYKRGISGTAYRPGIDAGWGATMGMADAYVGPVRAYYPDADELAATIDRIRQLRTGRTYNTSSEKVQARDMLADARAVLRPGEAGMAWGELAARLADTWPEFYAGITADMVRESLARYDVPTQDVKVNGKNLKGARRTALDAAQQRRELEAE